MARRKGSNSTTPKGHGAQGLVLLGDVRQAPIEIREGKRTFTPVVAIWARADDGHVVGYLVDEPGHPAQTLVQALRAPTPVPGEPQAPAMPSRIVLFNQELAKQVKPMLAPLNIEVMISPPFEPFDELFVELFAQLQQSSPGLDLPEDVLRPLISAAERLWRAKPWDYAFDDPPFGLVPDQDKARPLFASILGANKEVFGVALYTSAEDYEATLMLGEETIGPPPETMSAAALDAAASEVLRALRHRAFLVSFEPKDEMPSTYREHLARSGWPGRLSTVPTFAAMGGGEEPVPLTAEEAAEVAVAVDSLVTFCERHRKRIANERFPVRDTVEVNVLGKTVRVDMSVPGEDPSAPPATVY